MTSLKGYLLNFWGIAFCLIAAGMLLPGLLNAIDIDPGQDSTYCSGSTFILGGSPTAKDGFAPYTYEWESDNDSLTINDPTIANPTITVPKGFGPATVIFTLKVTDNEGFECTKDVTITIAKLGEIEFSVDYLPLNGQTAIASVTEVPPGTNITWSIEGDHLNAEINAQGVITSGSIAGSITVKATISNADSTLGCSVTAELCIDNEPCCEVTSSRTFGPVTIEFGDGEIKTNEVTADGYCKYTDIPAKVELLMAGGHYEATFELPDITISWEERLVDEVLLFRNVKIEWQNNPGIELTEDLADRISVNIIQASLQINENGELSGDLTFAVSLDEPVNLFGDMINLREGLSGTFTYTYNPLQPFGGTFDMEGIENIKIDLDKKNYETGVLTTLATIEAESFNKDGELINANFVLDTDAAIPIFDISSFKVKFNAFNLVFDFSLFDMEVKKFKSGNVNFDVFDIENVEGKLVFDATYQDNAFVTTGTLEDITAFGMVISGQVTLTLTDSLTFTSISLNNISAQHEKFDQSITNVTMEVKLGTLHSFSADAVVLKYNNGISFMISDISYTNDSLQLNAKILITEDFELNVIGFRISTTGGVSIKEVNGHINKSPIIADVKAVFAETYFEGNFNASLLNVLGGGATIQIEALVGTANDGGADYLFGRFLMSATVTGPAGILLGNTGLKLTGVGGLFGYNWYVPPIGEGESNIPTGYAQQGAITLGMSVTVGDIANNFAVTLAAAVSWGVENLTLTASADLKVPPAAPHYVSGTVAFQFNLNNGDLRGPFTGSIKVPRNSGKLIDMTGAISFAITQPNWLVSKNPDQSISGTIFEVINFEATSFGIQGPLNTQGIPNITGLIVGNFSYTFPSVEVSFPSGFDDTNCQTAGNTSYFGTSYTTGFGFSAVFNNNITGNLHTNYNGSNFAGSVGFQLITTASVKVAWPGWTCSSAAPLPQYPVSINGYLEIELIGNVVTVSGDLTLTYGNQSASGNVEFTL